MADVDRAAREGRESASWLAVQYLCRGDARLEQLGESEAGGERAEELRGEGEAGSVWESGECTAHAMVVGVQ